MSTYRITRNSSFRINGEPFFQEWAEVPGAYLGAVWQENCDPDEVPFFSGSPRDMLAQRLQLVPDEATAFVADAASDEGDTTFAGLCMTLAERYGWDTTLYRADFLNGTCDGGEAAYSPDTVNEEQAYIEAFRFCGWQVEEVNDHDD